MLTNIVVAGLFAVLSYNGSHVTMKLIILLDFYSDSRVEVTESGILLSSNNLFVICAE